MINISRPKHRLALSIFAAALALAPLSCRAAESGFAEVHSPQIPSSVKFADTEVSLQPVQMWERLDRELSSMAYTHGNTLLTFKRANKYFPLIAPVLKSEGVPSDLIYIAVIESTLNPRAVSGAKAAGLWQFMPSTAREFGLEVNDYVDERFDPVKSTRAAARYLKNAYAKYGNWESVAASYNGGMGRVSGELASQQEKSAYDLYLPEETMRYMFRLLAAKMLMENPAAYGYRLRPEDLYQAPDYEEFEVATPVTDWQVWAKEHGSNYLTLREHNPWIRAKSLPNPDGKKYIVKLPSKNSLKRGGLEMKVYDKRWIYEPSRPTLNCY